MKKLKKLITLAALLVLCLALTACGGSKLNLSDYLSVSFSGIDGSGTAYLQFDASQMELDYAGVKDGYPTQKQFDKMLNLAPFEFSVNYELDKSENLKNGDKVTATITYGKERAKEAKVKVGSTTRTFTVEGLIEPILIDPFDESIFGEGKTVDIRLEGIDPYVEFSLINNADHNDPVSYISYDYTNPNDEDLLSFSKRLYNGDQVTITATLSNEAVKNGYILTRDETVFTVEGCDRWARAVEDLPADFLSEVKEKAYQDCLSREETKLYRDIYDLGFRPSGARVENVRVGDTAILFANGYKKNQLVIPIYKTIVTDQWNDYPGEEYYTKTWEDVIYYYEFNNIVAHADGTVNYDDSGKIESFGGYVDPDVANERYLRKYKENYQFIVDIKLP